MVALRRIKFGKRLDLCDDLGRSTRVVAVLLDLLKYCLDCLQLFRLALIIKNDGSVLASHVLALPVGSGRVVNVHEDIEKGCILLNLLS